MGTVTDGRAAPLTTPPTERIARECRLRLKLMKRGYRLMRSRRRSLPPEMRGYLVVEFATARVVAGDVPALFSLSLDQAEAWARRLGRP